MAIGIGRDGLLDSVGIIGVETIGGFRMDGIPLGIHGMILSGIHGFIIPGDLLGVLIGDGTAGDGTVGDGITGVGEDITILIGVALFGEDLMVIRWRITEGRVIEEMLSEVPVIQEGVQFLRPEDHPVEMQWRMKAVTVGIIADNRRSI